MDDSQTPPASQSDGNHSPVADNNAGTTGNTTTTALQTELEQMKAIAQRALADLQNLQRRTAEERTILYPQAQADLMVEFLPVIDNFARAFGSIPSELAGNEWVQGVNQIEKQFTTILAKIGLTEINPEGQPFDPNHHDAMMEIAGPKNQVVQVLEKGYLFKTKVIRPAKVSVGNG